MNSLDTGQPSLALLAAVSKVDWSAPGILASVSRWIAEMVKPAERIDSIRIHNITGLGGGKEGKTRKGGDKTPVNQALDSILGMAVQLPALKSLGDELGLSMKAAARTVKEPPDDRG